MKIEHRICPGCFSVFFAFKSDEVVICPICKFILLDRRDNKTKRIQKRVNFVFSINDERFDATLEDYSAGGMRAVYHGRPLKPGMCIEFDVKELNLRGSARTVWTTKPAGLLASSGFSFA